MTFGEALVTPGKDKEIWRLNDLRIDVRRGTVHRGDEEIVLPRLSFELLIALVHAAPGIAAHDRLLDEVWPDVTVNEETLKQRVKLLRAALGDSSSQPRYIANVRGRGYRLAGPVVAEARAEPRRHRLRTP